MHSRHIDVRVLAATNRNLEQMIEDGQFREDLYFRLNVVQLEVPPLRERKEDILPLAIYFLNKFNRMYGQEKVLTYEVEQEMENEEWKGNVRELKNIVENMVIVSNNEYLQVEDLPWVTGQRRRTGEPSSPVKMIANLDLTLEEATEELEKIMLYRYIKEGKTTRDIAEALGVNQSTVVRKMQKYQMKRE